MEARSYACCRQRNHPSGLFSIKVSYFSDGGLVVDRLVRSFGGVGFLSKIFLALSLDWSPSEECLFGVILSLLYLYVCARFHVCMCY